MPRKKTEESIEKVETRKEESPPELLTIEEAARLLRKSRVTMHRYVSGGKVRAYQVAGAGPLLFKRADLMALLVPVRAESLTDLTEVEAAERWHVPTEGEASDERYPRVPGGAGEAVKEGER
jgi:excisionase family DNA binding protein